MSDLQKLNKVIFIYFFSVSFYFYNPVGANPNKQFNLNQISSADSLKDLELYRKGRLADIQGDYKGSLDFFHQQLSLRKKLYGEYHFKLASLYMYIGIEYKNLGKLNEAITNYLFAEKIYIDSLGRNNSRLGFVYTNLGNVYKQKGNFADALKYHQQALISLKNDIHPDQLSISQVDYNICENYFFIKEYEKSLNQINENIRHADPSLLWKYYDLMANIYYDKREYDLADRFFLNSIKEFINFYGEEDYDLGYAYLNYAQFLLNYKKFDKASKYIDYAKLIVLSQSINKGIDVFNLFITIGELYTKKIFDSNSLEDFRKKKITNLKQALEFYQKAIFAVTNNFNDPNPEVNPQHQQCIFQSQCLEAMQSKSSAYYEMAKLSESDESIKLKYLSNSLDAINIASDLLNKLRTEAVNEDSKILISQLQNSTFLKSINIAAELFKITSDESYFEIAFHNAERGKAASLMDNLTEQSAKEISLIPDSLITKEENINLQITYLNEEIFEESQNEEAGNDKLDEYRSQLFLLEKDKNDLNNFLENEYKEYYKLKYAGDKLSLKDIQKQINHSEAVIEYVFDWNENNESNNVFIFVLSSNDVMLKKIPITNKEMEDIKLLHNFLSDPNYINISKEKYNSYLGSAYSLYSFLIKPIEEELSNKDITIIPDGILSYIPFDALLYDKVESPRINFRNLPYLIGKYTFNYSYSTNLYLNRFAKKKRAKGKLLAFSPSYKVKNDDDEEFNQLLPLRGISEEVKNIAEYIESDVYLDEAATESNFMKKYQDYDILHLAMHTLLNDSLPMFSKLAFTPPADSTDNTDGWLSTQEIYNLQLNSRLAVLSACNTGSGVLKKGEGVISLARGFFYAGCPAIIMTLWEIEDRSGTTIMDEFYRLLSKGKKKNEALRLSKLKHIESADPLKAHPHYWLGYVSIGNTDAIYASNDIYFFGLILLILVFVIVDQTFRYKKARQKARLLGDK